jgi:RimJ/RimL family protein N-acetyltransferase
MTQAVLDEPTEQPGSGPAPTTSPDRYATLLRAGHGDDAAALIAMHARCSTETIQRRYHSPMPHLSPGRARALLSPLRGWSLVMTYGSELVGIATLARDHDGGYEVGLLVEDQWQQQGAGSRLLHALARQAAHQGIARLVCYIQPGNHAMLATIRRAGFNARITTVDGLLAASIPIKPMRRRSKGPQHDAAGPHHEQARSDAARTRGTSQNPSSRASHRPRYNCSAVRHRPRLSRGHAQPMNT